MRILFLDDDPVRHHYFGQWTIGHIVTFVWNAEQALKRLATEAFDLVFLDHDLGGKTMVDSSEPNTGYTVAKAMAASVPERKPRVVVHSMNPAGAKNMVLSLDEAGYRVDWRPFGPSILDGLA